MLTTIIFFILGLIASYFIARWQMKKNKIVHFTINSYEIGKGLSDEFPEFKLHYDGEDLAGDVKVLKGGFMNIGRNDIDGLKGENDIKLIFPEGCKVRAVNILTSVEELSVSSKMDEERNNVLNFGISDVLKSDEFFKYTAIFEASKDIKEIHSELKFQHRIINTDIIRSTYIGQQSSSSWKKRNNILLLLIVSMVFLLISEIITSLYQRTTYKIYQTPYNKEVKIHIDPYSNLYVNEGVSIPFVSGTKITSEEFEKYCRIVPITEFRWSIVDTISTILNILMFAFVLLYFYKVLGKNAHIINVLKENEDHKE